MKMDRLVSRGGIIKEKYLLILNGENLSNLLDSILYFWKFIARWAWKFWRGSTSPDESPLIVNTCLIYLFLQPRMHTKPVHIIYVLSRAEMQLKKVPRLIFQKFNHFVDKFYATVKGERDDCLAGLCHRIRISYSLLQIKTYFSSFYRFPAGAINCASCLYNRDNDQSSYTTNNDP